jgi:uncharacterized damage-inducible protein DinB
MTRPPVQDIEDPRRSEPDYLLPEREMLESWLEFHRFTLLLKCEGLSGADLKRQPVSTSKLSLHGLVRHMAEVERGWFRRCFLRQADLPYLYVRDDGGSDLELEPLDDAVWDDDLRSWQEECETSRAAAAGRSLEETGIRRGDEVPLRWIFSHMIEEYARHNGHADLIREMIDGAVGW